MKYEVCRFKYFTNREEHIYQNFLLRCVRSFSRQAVELAILAATSDIAQVWEFPELGAMSAVEAAPPVDRPGAPQSMSGWLARSLFLPSIGKDGVDRFVFRYPKVSSPKRGSFSAVATLNLARKL